ncbi:MAG: hypothetical protein L3J56_00880 [Bacteroidales bacterium]|nr:hypothetical protein [Bacteroidales bacterium]
MNSFKLTNTNLVKRFLFDDEDSYFRIVRLSVHSLNRETDKLKLSEIISNFHLKVLLRYVVYEHENYTDERIESFPIFFVKETNQIQPIFNLNTLIKNKTFTIGISIKKHFYNELTIELINKSGKDFDSCFNIEYEESKMKET